MLRGKVFLMHRHHGFDNRRRQVHKFRINLADKGGRVVDQAVDFHE